MLKKARIYYWTISTFVRRHRQFSLFLIIFILFFGLSFNFLSRFFYEPLFSWLRITHGSEVIEGQVGSLKVINPLFASASEKEIAGLIFRGLTKTSSSGEVSFDLADEITVDSDKEYTFRIKKDIYWHDGRPLTADDVVYTYEYIANPQNKTAYGSTFKDVKISKIDDYTVHFVLKDTFSPFLSETSVGIIPKHIPLQQFRPIGTGAFRVTSFNKNYVKIESPKRKFTFKFYPTYDLALLALKQGEIDSLGGLSYDQIKDFANWPNLTTREVTLGNRYLAAFFNTQNTVLSTKSVRQALLYGIDKNRLLTSLGKNVGDTTFSSIGQNSWAKADDIKKYEYNLETAKNMLDKEGWKMSGEVRQKEDKTLTLSVAYLASPEFEKVTTLLESELNNLGIKIERRPYSNSQIRDQIIRDRAFDIVISSNELKLDPDQYVFWHSTQANSSNITGLSSARVDKALEDGRKIFSQVDRKEKYKEFQKNLVDEAPALFLYYPRYFYITNSRIQGIDLSTVNTPSDRLINIENWLIR